MVLHVFPSTDVFFVFSGLRNLIVLRLYIGGLSVFLNEKIVFFTFVPGICNDFSILKSQVILHVFQKRDQGTCIGRVRADIDPCAVFGIHSMLNVISRL